MAIMVDAAVIIDLLIGNAVQDKDVHKLSGSDGGHEVSWKIKQQFPLSVHGVPTAWSASAHVL